MRRKEIINVTNAPYARYAVMAVKRWLCLWRDVVRAYVGWRGRPGGRVLDRLAADF